MARGDYCDLYSDIEISTSKWDVDILLEPIYGFIRCDPHAFQCMCNCHFGNQPIFQPFSVSHITPCCFTCPDCGMRIPAWQQLTHRQLEGRIFDDRQTTTNPSPEYGDDTTLANSGPDAVPDDLDFSYRDML